MSSNNTPMDCDEEDDEFRLSDEEGGIRVEGIYIPPPPKAYCSTESKGPRLVITHITNNFFKSYAESVVLGPFHKCFNAIVGPNGSGKSNVIDSMLFVFGYRATKIRSKKISVLIHNSEQHPKVDSCEVTVHFAQIIDKLPSLVLRDGEDFEVVPGSEFHVTRIANKDNSSYYLLNGKRTQFKDIAVILRNHGIDLDHNRFLILQGEVEQISLMSPKGSDGGEPGMLEYLEDIIGTTRYKDSIGKLNYKVEILTEQRSEKLNRLNLVQQELNELKGPMQEAVQFLTLENEITSLKNVCYQKNIYNLKLVNDQLEIEKVPVESMVEDVSAKIADAQSKKKTKMLSLKETSSKYEDLEKRKDGLKEAFEKANTKDVQLQAEMIEVNNTRKKTKELLLQEERLLESYNKSPAQTEVKIKELEDYEKTLQNKRQGFEEEKVKALQTLKNQTNDLQKKREALETPLIELNKIVNETKTVFTLAESELKIYTSNETSEKEKLENLQKMYETSEEGLTTKQVEVEKLMKIIPEKEQRLHSSSKELETIKNQEMELLNNLRRKRAMLEESVSLMQANRSKGRVLDALMQQKREGKCPGLYGRLGDLGAIDLKYDVAVSTACGPLDNIVVDTVDTAEWCINFLKKNDIGRVTIIALEKQEHLRRFCNSKINTPEDVPRLFDLIRVADDRVRPAFYYAIRDTLVADNLDQASRIAYGAKRYRVVTLNGDIIEMTGTMSGGGRQVSRGRMGQSVTTTNFNPKEIEKAEHEVNNLEQKLRELRSKETGLAEEVAGLNPEVKQMKFASEKYVVELKALQKQLPSIKEQLNRQEKKVKTLKVDPARLKQLENEVTKSKVKYNEALENAQVLQGEVNIISDEIQSKSQGQMRAVEKNLTDNKKLIEKTKVEIAKMKVGIKTAERNSQKSKDKIATMQGNITDMENRLRKMKGQRDEIEVDAKKLMECLEDIEEKLAKIEEVEGLKSEVDKLLKLEQHLKSEKIEIDEKMKQITAKINGVTAKIHQWQARINHLQIQEIPDVATEPLKTYTDEEIQQEDIETLEHAVQSKEEVFKSLKPNLNTINEYRDKMKVFVGRSKELDDVSERRKKVRGHFDSLCNRRKQEFLTGYDIIKTKLKEMYQMITLGGDAAFELRDSFDPFSEGVQFKVRPPKKTWKEITNLSGGEKTLSSLALVFALHYYKPSPLYVMDEIDAALDFKNVSIVGNYIKERTKNAQFVIISLRSNMFELCDRLVGIYKTYNCTKSLAIDPSNFDNNNRDDYDKSGKPRDPRTRPESTIMSSQITQSQAIVVDRMESVVETAPVVPMGCDD